MNKDDEDTKTTLAAKILGVVFAIVIGAIALTLVVRYITKIWPALLIIALVIAAIVVAYRLYKHYKERNKW